MIDLHDYCEFNERRVYVLLAISRKGENDQITTNREVVFREVIKDAGDIGGKLQRIRAQSETYTPDEGGNLNFRLYLTVNARDVINAYFNYRARMNGWAEDLYRGDDAALPKMKKVDGHWISELQRPENRAEKLFMFDVDDVNAEEAEEFETALRAHTSLCVSQETPNGYHMVTKPFDYTRWRHPHPYELKTDGLLHVGVIE